MADFTVTIAKLHELKGRASYANWAATVKAVLRGKGVWWHVNDSYPRPTSNGVGMEKWDDNNGLALFVILQGLSPEILASVRHIEVSKALWDDLKDSYGDQGAWSRFTKFGTWFEMQYWGEDAEDFLERYKAQCVARKRADASDEEAKVFAFLCKVQSYHREFQQKARERLIEGPFPTLDECCELLLAEVREEDRRWDKVYNEDVRTS